MSEAVTTLPEVLARRAALHPDRPAFTHLSFPPSGAVETVIGYGRLFASAVRIAAALREHGPAGSRALLVFPSGLEFVESYFGCLLAGWTCVACPLPNPAQPAPGLAALGRVVRDVGLGARGERLAVIGPARELDGLRRGLPDLSPLWLPFEAFEAQAMPADLPPPDPDGVAMLLYSSGSTGDPKGIMVSQAALLANVRQAERSLKLSPDIVNVSWLPHTHNMGLVGTIAAPVFAGCHNVLFSPADFLRDPSVWLRTLSERRAYASGGPNFAFDLCAQRIGAAQKATLDLGAWRVAYTGGEPVNPRTFDRFVQAFEGCGFRRESLCCGYGLSETTSLLTMSEVGRGPVPLHVSTPHLERRQVVPVAHDDREAKLLVGTGRLAADSEVVVVDPATGARLPPGRAVGEIWTRGPQLASGYWGRPELTRHTFGARLENDDRPWFRTGDLGFMVDGELFVTGRVKEIIIVRGRNHIPQDIERTAVESHPALAGRTAVAFAIAGPADDGADRLVVAVECGDLAGAAAPAVLDALRGAINLVHGVDAAAIALVAPESIPRTAGGKLRRPAARDAWLAGGLPIVALDPPVGAPVADAGEAVPAVDPVAEAIRRTAAATVRQVLGIRPGRALDGRRKFVEMGMDSVKAVELTGELQQAFGQRARLPDATLWLHPTFDSLADFLVAVLAGAGPAEAREDTDTDIDALAVIGLAARFPGHADSAAAYWQRLHEAALDGADPTPTGGADEPLLIDVALEALADAAIAPGSLAGSRTGVFVAGAPAGGLADRLALHGPTLQLAPAASASLVALHLAGQSLRLGESTRAIVGGLHLLRDAGGSLRQGGACAVVLLKRLRDALRDGDTVRAVLRGSSVGRDAPGAPGHVPFAAVLADALARAGLAPRDVGYFLLQGAGDAAQDVDEARALTWVMSRDRAPGLPLFVSSLRSRFGDLGPAAGIAGVVHAVLALDHEALRSHPPRAATHPRFDLAAIPAAWPSAPTPWRRTAGRRRVAGIRAVDPDGTAAALFLDEAPGTSTEPEVPDRPAHLLALSARSPGELAQIVAAWARHLGQTAEPLADLCFTANIGRDPHPYRRAAWGADASTIAAQLLQPAAGDASAAGGGTPARLGVVFPDELPFDPAAARRFGRMQPVFQAALDRCAEAFGTLAGAAAMAWLRGSAGQGPVDAVHRQVGGFALQFALGEMLAAFGVEPHAMAGRGLGEYAAAALARALDPAAAIAMILARPDPAAFARELDRLRDEGLLGAPSRRLVSGPTGRLAAPGETRDPAYWLRQANDPGRLGDTVRAMTAAGANRFLVIGADTRLAQALAEASGAAVSCSGVGDWPSLLDALAAHFEAGGRVDWKAFEQGLPRRRLPLPLGVFRVQTTVVREPPPDCAFALRTFHSPVLGALRVAETGQGPPLLCLSGMLRNHTMWRRLAAGLAGAWRLVIVDAPGIGGSNLYDDLSFDGLVDAHREVLDALDLRQPVPLLGYSLGSMIGLSLALRHPDRVSALVLIGPSSTGADLEETIRRYRDEVELHHMSQYPDASTGHEMGNADRYARVVQQFHCTDSLHAVHAPVLLIAGEHDLIAPPAHARLMQRNLPDAELHLVPDAGHFLAVTHSERMVALTQDFLRRRAGVVA